MLLVIHLEVYFNWILTVLYSHNTINILCLLLWNVYAYVCQWIQLPIEGICSQGIYISTYTYYKSSDYPNYRPQFISLCNIIGTISTYLMLMNVMIYYNLYSRFCILMFIINKFYLFFKLKDTYHRVHL